MSRITLIFTPCVCVLLVASLFAQIPQAARGQIDPRGISGSLVICGGGKLDDSIIERFIELAGDADAKLVIVPTASRRADEQDVSSLLEPWADYPSQSLTLLHSRDRVEVNTEQFLQLLEQATGVWFSGGSQSRIAEAYVGTRFETALNAVLKRGGVVGGTSAGAAIMSRTMIARGNPEPTIATGFALLPGTIIDQHFRRRDRLPRLRRAISQYPKLVGIGIDEGTAIEVHGRRIHVLGKSKVTFVLAEANGRPETLTELQSGEQADLIALQRAARDIFPDPDRRVPEVAAGSLVIVGGGAIPDSVTSTFIKLAGGPNASIVFLPTASPDSAARRARPPRFLADADIQDLHVLPQRWQDEVESDEFKTILRKATGIWFDGGRQWRFVDAYQGTSAIELFHSVLRRGGVIGGTSAGASIQAEYLVRGHPLGNEVMMAAGYERGFGFLPGTAIDQHFAQRERFKDLEAVIHHLPQLLGIGVDEATAIVVRGATADVVGKNHVYFYHAPKTRGKDFDIESERFGDGQIYDLRMRRELLPATDAAAR